MGTLYDDDLYGWAVQQADALKHRSSNEIDWDNVAEEIEALGKSQASELRSRFAVLLAHLLKWRFQSERRGVRWSNTIRTQRALIAEHLDDNPGLKSRSAELFARAYLNARGEAASEMGVGIEALPEACPFSLTQSMDPVFWPEPEGEETGGGPSVSARP